MPLDMPESVLVRFKGKRQPGVTLRDLVHAIPMQAIKEGHLTVAKAGKKNVFSGRVLEIEGLDDLTVEQAFESVRRLRRAPAAAGCTITLSEDSVSEYLKSNITLLKWMIGNGYGDARTLERRIQGMEEWLANPSLMRADADAEYHTVIEIDMDQIKEPVLCCPNDPDDAKTLSDVAGASIDEVFIGSCMTNIGHFPRRRQAAGESGRSDHLVCGWHRPPRWTSTSSPKRVTTTSSAAPVRAPKCRAAPCAWVHQARVAAKSTVVSTSTRNSPQPPRPGRGRLPGVGGTGGHRRGDRQTAHRRGIHGVRRHHRLHVR